MKQARGQPRNVVCHLCGKPTSLTGFLGNHVRTCEKMWREDESTTVKALVALDRRHPHHIPEGSKGRDVPGRPKLPDVDGTPGGLVPDENIDDEGLLYYNELATCRFRCCCCCRLRFVNIWDTHWRFLTLQTSGRRSRSISASSADAGSTTRST